MKILVVDNADGTTDTQALKALFKPDLTLALAGMSNGIGQLMADIQRLVPPGGIHHLIIKGHGNSGLQGLGVGQGVIPNADGTETRVRYPELPAADQFHWSLLNAEFLAVPDNALIVGSIHHHFARTGFVELYGCHTGEGAKGYTLLKKLASLWGVPVSASTWSNEKLSTSRSGSIITVSPNGSSQKQSWASAEQLKVIAGRPKYHGYLLLKTVVDKMVELTGAS